MRASTKRKPIQGSLDKYIGHTASINIVATMRAKLIAVGDLLCLLETAPTPYPNQQHYNCAVGQTFTLSTQDVRMLHWVD